MRVTHLALRMALAATLAGCDGESASGGPREQLVVEIVLSPDVSTVPVGGTQQFTVRAVSNTGDTIPGDVQYRATGGKISPNGEYLAGSQPGTYAVVATERHTGLEDSATVTIVEYRPPPSRDGVVLVGAGDIADCDTETDEATATVLDAIEGTVFTAGDNAYPDGTAVDFAQCFEPTWGRHKARTRPSPGNHDYHTPDAAAYFAYFGDNAGVPAKGYYSYDLGDWHIIALNSNVDMSRGSPQEQWLREDLAANDEECTLAYWHHARFSSGSEHGSDEEPQPLWEALYQSGADVILVGHDHHYERFAAQTPTGTADPDRGIRQFVVGTGGTDLRPTDAPVANSEVRNSDAHGVLKLTLFATSYAWAFVPVAGKTFRDSGSASCH